MNLYELAYGPLLFCAFSLFVTGLVMRFAFFVVSILRGRSKNDDNLSYIVALFGRAFFPFHSAIIRRPLYAGLRYSFHIWLLVVPIWLEGHIALWEESRFEWYWTALPEVWADRMTLGVIIIAGIFLIRRTFIPQIRQCSSPYEYVLIFIALLPFVSGYLFSHGNLDDITFFRNHLETIHTLSGEIFIVSVIFLFCRTKLNAKRCVGCAACETVCPTGTLHFEDENKFRNFYYRHYQCICCGSCVKICPEEAAELRHEIGFRRLFRVLSKEKIRSVPLSECLKCRTFFAPEPQVQRIGQIITDGNYQLCLRCRVTNYIDVIKRTAGTPRMCSPFSKSKALLKE